MAAIGSLNSTLFTFQDSCYNILDMLRAHKVNITVIFVYCLYNEEIGVDHGLFLHMFQTSHKKTPQATQLVFKPIATKYQ